MTELPSIETRRLRLRVPTPDDATSVATYMAENRAHFAPWDPLRSDEYFSPAYWERELAKVVEDAHSQTRFMFTLQERGSSSRKVAGHCTFSGIVRGPFQASYLGYGLHHESVGAGLMEEALRAAIGYCFTDLNLHRVMANYMPSNVRSARLLRKLGFVPEGYARDYLCIAGSWEDHVLTALTNPDWTPSDHDARPAPDGAPTRSDH